MAVLIFLTFILFGLISFSTFGPSLFSYQDNIDPTTISENYDSLAKFSIFNNNIYPISQTNPVILGDNISVSNNPDRRIEVDLTNQRLYAYEKNQLIYNFLISSGSWDRTPRGNFTIWIKIRSQKMSGGSKKLGTYYYLPNVPYILFFYNEKISKRTGYSIHGTYWHDNFGTPMSHGCINMKTSEAALIYNWAEVGTQITIYGKYKYSK